MKYKYAFHFPRDGKETAKIWTALFWCVNPKPDRGEICYHVQWGQDNGPEIHMEVIDQLVDGVMRERDDIVELDGIWPYSAKTLGF